MNPFLSLEDPAVTLRISYFGWYLLIGVVLFLPLNCAAHRQVHNHGPFWPSLADDVRRRGVRRYLLAVVVAIVAWPLAIWEVVR